MITLDTATLRFRALNVQGCYMAGIDNQHVKEVLLNGNKSHDVFYCDVNSGFAVINKKNIDGTVLVADDGIIYDVFFGKVEVIHE